MKIESFVFKRNNYSYITKNTSSQLVKSGFHTLSSVILNIFFSDLYKLLKGHLGGYILMLNSSVNL